VAIAARRTPCAVTTAWGELGPAALTVSRAFPSVENSQWLWILDELKWDD
jgi:hypothetical protein